MEGLSAFCLYRADNVKKWISGPAELVISFSHHLEQRALKYLVTTEHKRNL